MLQLTDLKEDSEVAVQFEHIVGLLRTLQIQDQSPIIPWKLLTVSYSYLRWHECWPLDQQVFRLLSLLSQPQSERVDWPFQSYLVDMEPVSPGLPDLSMAVTLLAAVQILLGSQEAFTSREWPERDSLPAVLFVIHVTSNWLLSVVSLTAPEPRVFWQQRELSCDILRVTSQSSEPSQSS